MVEVSSATGADLGIGSRPTVGGYAVQFTTDGGQTWNPIFSPNTGFVNNVLVNQGFFYNVGDPTNFDSQLGFGSDPYGLNSSVSVAFDRNENFYIVSNEFNSAGNSGAIVFDSFQFIGGPNGASQNTSIGNKVLYQWFNQDPAYNPVVAVDANLPATATSGPSFTDPQVSGATQTDTMAVMIDPTTGAPSTSSTAVPKGIYVGWNTNNTEPNGSSPATVSHIMIAASGDGGKTFTTQQYADGFGGAGSAPQILFTQGTTANSARTTAIPGGQMNIVYNNLSGGTVIQQSQPDGGVASNDAAATATFSSTDTPVPIGDAGPTPSGGNANIPVTTSDSITVTSTAFPMDFAKIDDIEVTVDIVHPHMNQVSLVLVPPPGSGLTPITLLANATDAAGNGTGQGIANQANLGTLTTVVNNTNIVHNVGTVFDPQAQRAISDGSASSPWIGHFRPAGTVFDMEGQLADGSLPQVDGLTAAAVSGTWTLEITDYRNDGTINGPFPARADRLLAALHQPDQHHRLRGGVNTGTGDPTTYAENGHTRNAPTFALTGSASNVYPTALGAGAAGTPGAGPGIVAAVDNTLGAFSPFQGRLYLAFTTGTNIFTIHSDNDGATWSQAVQINDDTAADNFSEGNRPEFMPSIAVDPITGTVVVDYYDGRFDAADARVATSISVSVDGGDHWSTSTPLNQLTTATDAITGDTIVVAPIPGNETAAGTFGFGDRQAIVAYDGVVTTAFTSNLNAAGSAIETATVTIPSGPTVVSGDMGAIVADSVYQPTLYADSRGPGSGANGGYIPVTYNNVFAADGTRELQSFEVTFDRPVDPSTFTPNQIQVLFRDPEGDAPVVIPVESVTPLDGATLFGPAWVGGIVGGLAQLATQFLITLMAPQSAVGTYSYAVGLNTSGTDGTLVSDRIRSIPTGNAANQSPTGVLRAGPSVIIGTAPNQHTVLLGTNMNQDQGAITNVTHVQGVNTITPIQSTDTPKAVPNGGATTTDVIAVNDPYQQITQDFFDPIEIKVDVALASSQTLTLSLVSPDGTTITLGTKTFSPTNGVATVIFADYNPYNLGNSVKPSTRLASLINENANGNWTLKITNSGNAVTLNDWQLILPLTTDEFAVPNPVNGVPFQFPYTNQTQPLIVPGPHVVSTAVVSTGTFNNVTTYTTNAFQSNQAVSLAAGATTAPRQLLLPITDAFQVQQTAANHIEVHVDLAGVASGDNLRLRSLWPKTARPSPCRRA